VASFAGIASLFAVGGASALGLTLAGIPMLPEPPEQVAAAPAVVDQRKVIAAKDSPAVLTINKLMAGTAKLDATGQVKPGGSPALPFSCPAGNYGASYSAARTFVHQEERLQVVASAYPAGYGAVAFDAFRTQLRGCASGVGSINSWTDKVDGNTALLVDLRQSGGTTRTMMLRIGDNLIHIQGPTSQLHSAAREVAGVFKSSGTCASTTQGAEAFSRNPLAGNGFEGYYVSETVKVDKPKTPKIPEDAEFEEVNDELPPLPAPVTPMTQPSFAVYPAMPSAVKYPVKPVKPAEPELSSDIMVNTQDEVGPGCGWAYTGSPGAVWDAQGALKENAQSIDDATGKLNDGVKEWTELTLAYWEDSAKYEKAVDKYEKYAQQVTDVNTAWVKISDTWETYNTELANWQEREDAIKTFADDQAKAIEQFETELAECKAEAAKPAPTPTPTPTPTPEIDPETGEEITPDPEPSVEPEPVSKPVNCDEDVKRPAIIDQTAPEPLQKPVEPADPRPEG